MSKPSPGTATMLCRALWQAAAQGAARGLLALLAALTLGGPPLVVAQPHQATQPAALEGRAWQLADAAYRAYDEGNYPVAQDLAQQAIALRPDLEQLRLLLVYTLQKQGKDDAAKAAIQDARDHGIDTPALRQAVANLPVSGHAQSQADTSAAALAYAAYDRQQYDEAIQHARQAYAEAPNDAERQRLLITTLSAGTIDNAREAREMLDGALGNDPDNATLLVQRGYVLQRLGLPGLAAGDFRRARQSGGAPPALVLDEAYAHAGNGDRREAVGLLREAIDHDDAGRLSLTEQQRYDARGSIAGLSREWGATFSASYRGAQPAYSSLGGAAISTPGDTVFSTAEVFWRPSALNARQGMLEIYGRVSNTLYDAGSKYESRRGFSCDQQTIVDYEDPSSSKNRVTTGAPSSIGSLGLRYSVADTGLIFGIERRQFLGSATRQGDVYSASAHEDCAIRQRVINGLSPGGGSAIHDLIRQEVNSTVPRYRMRGDAGGWMTYASYGFYKGVSLPHQRSRWWTVSGYVQAGYAWDNNRVRYTGRSGTGNHYDLGSGRLKRRQAFASAEARVGPSIRMTNLSDKLTLFPHVVVGADWLWQKEVAHFGDLPGAGSQAVTLASRGSSWSAGAGLGLGARYWFRSDHYNAARSYLDFTLQYRAGLGGVKERAEGLFMFLTISY